MITRETLQQIEATPNIEIEYVKEIRKADGKVTLEDTKGAFYDLCDFEVRYHKNYIKGDIILIHTATGSMALGRVEGH